MKCLISFIKHIVSNFIFNFEIQQIKYFCSRGWNVFLYVYLYTIVIPNILEFFFDIFLDLF